MTETKLINEGYLVVGEIGQMGCVSYSRTAPKEERDGQRLEADWSTHKIVLSIDEQRGVHSRRGLLTRNISKLGAKIGGFGVYVRKGLGDELEAALSVARQSVMDYNATAKYTRLYYNFTVFEIGSADERVARAIYDGAVQLLGEINEAVEKGDVKALRAGIGRMKSIAGVIPASTGEKIQIQLKKASDAAKAAVKSQEETDTDKQKTDKVIEALSKVDMKGIRASLVETVAELDKNASNKSFVPNVNITNVRQIEAKLFAEINHEDEPKPDTKKKPVASKRAVDTATELKDAKPVKKATSRKRSVE